MWWAPLCARPRCRGSRRPVSAAEKFFEFPQTRGIPGVIVIPLEYCSDMPSNTSSLPGTPPNSNNSADLRPAEHHLARAVLAAGRLAGTGTCEKIEGLPLDLFIGLVGRLPAADRSTLIGAGQALLRMPATARLFEQGAISWGQVRRITKAARTLRADQRAELDACVAATAEEHSGLDAFGPDQLCDAVDAAADDLRDPRSIERREAAAVQANFLSVQHTLFNRVQIYADLRRGLRGADHRHVRCRGGAAATGAANQNPRRLMPRRR